MSYSSLTSFCRCDSLHGIHDNFVLEIDLCEHVEIEVVKVFVVITASFNAY